MKTPYEKRRISAFLNNEYRKLIGYVRRRIDEIAAQLSELWNIPLNTLLSRKSRAMKKLQQMAQGHANPSPKKIKEYHP